MNKLIFPILLCMLGLNSCDPALNSKKVIRNNSDHQIWIAFEDSKGMHHFNLDTIIIYPDSEVLIEESNGVGGLGYYDGICMVSVDSVHSGVFSADSLSLDIDFSKDENWIYLETERYNNDGGEYECTLIITNKNIK